MVPSAMIFRTVARTGEYWLMCAMPRGHPFEQADAVRLRDLKGEHFLARTHCENGSLLMEKCRRQGFELNIRYRSAREDWIQAMVAAGCGVTIIPEFSRIGRRIALRPIAEPALFRELSITTVAGRPHDTALRALLRELRAHKWENDDMPAGEGGRAAASPVQVLTLPGDETVDASG